MWGEKSFAFQKSLDFLSGQILENVIYKIFFPGSNFESLEAVVAPDGKSVMSRIECPMNKSSAPECKKSYSHFPLLNSLVRPLQYRTIKLSTPLISRREANRVMDL